MNKILLTVPDLKAAVAFYTELFGTEGTRSSNATHLFDYGTTQLICTMDKDEPEKDTNTFSPKVSLITTEHLEAFHQTATELLCQEVDECPSLNKQGALTFAMTDPFGNKLRFVKARAHAA